MLDVEKVETLDCVTPLAHNPLPQNRITDGVVLAKRTSSGHEDLKGLSLFWKSKQVVVDLDTLLTSGSGKPPHCVGSTSGHTQKVQME